MKNERLFVMSNDPITQHFDILSKLEEETNTETIKKLCIEDIGLLTTFKEEMKKRGDDMAKKDMELDRTLGLPVESFSYYQKRNSFYYNIPCFTTFKKLAIIYEKEKDYENAIKICRLAISEGQERDGTKAGMTGRLEKLLKKVGG